MGMPATSASRGTRSPVPVPPRRRRLAAEMPPTSGERLYAMLAGRRAPEIIEAACRFAEESSEAWRCGIYVLDWDGRGVRAWGSPSLPAGFNTAICELPRRDDAGPCMWAAWLKAEVIAADLESDPSWQRSPFRSLAIAHGIRACWSTPLYSVSGDVLGAVAILQEQPARPTQLQQELLARIAQVAGIAIEREQLGTRLDGARSDLAQMRGTIGLSAAMVGNLVEPLSGIVLNARTCLRIFNATPERLDGARETLQRTLRDCARVSEMIVRLRELLGPSPRDAEPGSAGATLR